MEALNKISLFTRLRGVDINDALPILQSFGSAYLTAPDTIGATSLFFVSNAQELFDGDDFCYCNQYRIDLPEKRICRVSLYYGNTSGKVVDVTVNWIRI